MDGRCTVHRCGYGNLSRCDHFGKEETQPLSAEECISKGVFGSDSNVFDSFRKEAASIPGKENTALAAATEVAKEDTDCNIRFYGLVENRQ